jgi:hypothetical protein
MRSEELKEGTKMLMKSFLGMAGILSMTSLPPGALKIIANGEEFFSKRETASAIGADFLGLSRKSCTLNEKKRVIRSSKSLWITL